MKDVRLMRFHLIISLALAFSACQTTAPTISGKPPSSLIARAKKFRSLTEAGDWEAARALVREHPRRWWDARDGDGQPWIIGPNSGPWAHWDVYFRSEKEELVWHEGERAVSVMIRENNDYYRLLERGVMTNEMTYFFDETGKIEGLLIRSAGERSPGKTDAFVAWARANHPEELALLMPNGEIDPSSDHPERFRRLLNEWRATSGLDPIR